MCYKYYVFGHYPSSCLYLKTVLFIFLKRNVSETGFCFHLQVKPIQLGPIARANLPNAYEYAQLSTSEQGARVIHWTTKTINE
jgi:hypothetical protein